MSVGIRVCRPIETCSRRDKFEAMGSLKTSITLTLHVQVGSFRYFRLSELLTCKKIRSELHPLMSCIVLFGLR